MIKAEYKITILAPREAVWSVLWDQKKYEEWTSVFCPGSTIETDWKEGGKVRFLGGDEGMYGIIARSIPNEYMSFKHLGVISGGKDLPSDENTKQWEGAFENYTLISTDKGTILKVDVDVEEEHKAIFDEVFPKGLKIVKHFAEDLNSGLLRAKASIQVQKPASEIFEAIVNPAAMVNYFISYGSGRMEEGKELVWRFPEFDGDAPVRVGKIIQDKLVSFYWDVEDRELMVEIVLEEQPDRSTVVRITEKSMENDKAGIEWVVGNTEGWANFLACLKAWLEYGVHLRRGAFDFMRGQL